MAAYLKNLVWPKSVLCVETLLAIAETGDDDPCVPDDIKEDVRGIFRSFGGTEVVENLFGKVGDDACRRRRWLQQVTSGILEDYDRRLLPLSAEARSVGSKLTVSNEQFVASTVEPSVPEAKLKEMLHYDLGVR